MRRLLSLAVLAGLAAALLAACAGGPAAPAEPQRAIDLERCRLSAPGLAATTTPAECGTLAVPENPTQPGGRMIDLRVVVVPAISADAESEPLFLLAGGPGQAASSAFTPLLPALEQVGQARDLVMVDQRGTGQSNPLTCPLEAEGLEESSGSPDDPAVRAWWSDCLASLDGDPAQYTTENAARDLDAVRAALGYERVSLLGVSYGTRLAQTYLRLFPDRVRAMVLDGVVPPAMVIGADAGRDGQRALDLTFAACEADPACAEAFPDLRGSFAALLARLADDPATVTLDDPFTGAPTEVELTEDLVTTTVFQLSYAPETVALLPLLIHTAQVDGDLRPLAAQSLLTTRELAEQIALGLRSSVICAEDEPLYATREVEAGYLGDLLARAFASACEVWPRGEVSEAFRDPVESPVPTLILSGERDPITPPAYGDIVAETLPNSRRIVADGQGHNIFYRGCIPGLVADFLVAGSASELDLSCAERLGAPPFFTSFTGPRP